MKRLLVYAGSALLLFTAVFAVFGALTSAFGFELPARQLLPVWAASALLLAVIVSQWRLRGLLLCLIPILAALYWSRQDIICGAKYVLFHITNEYDMWFGFPVLFRDVRATAHELVMFWRSAGLCLMLLLSTAVCIRRSAVWTVVITLPFVLPSFLMDEFPPGFIYLAGLFAVYLIMTFCSAFHPDDYRGRALAVFPSLALALVLMGTAYLIAPPGGYNRDGIIESLNERIRDMTRTPYESVFTGIGWPELFDSGWRFNTDEVEIASAGVRELSDQEALKISSSLPGTFYLRGYSMQYFDGRAWSENSSGLHADEQLANEAPAIIAQTYDLLNLEDAPVIASMTIMKTGDRTDVFYRPYYSLDYMPISSDFTGFYQMENTFIASAQSHPGVADRTYAYPESYNSWAQSTYTQIDVSTARELRRIANRAGIDAGAGRAKVADQVAKYVSSSARYTLSPYVTPDDEDFAVYFLEESRQGYCIHFATAAALMLRALDIPARFTTGFVVTVPDGKTMQDISVPYSSAHAWVEVYYDDIGWVPLEATPSSGQNGIPDRVPHTASSPAEPVTPSPSELPEETSGTAPHALPGEETEATPSPSPTGGAAAGTGSTPKNSKGLGTAPTVTLCAFVFAALLYLRLYFARRSREHGFNQEDTSAAALYAWRYVHRADYLVNPPKTIEALALKARFGKHRLTEEERETVVSYAVTFGAEAYARSGMFRRFWMRCVLGL